MSERVQAFLVGIIIGICIGRIGLAAFGARLKKKMGIK